MTALLRSRWLSLVPVVVGTLVAGILWGLAERPPLDTREGQQALTQVHRLGFLALWGAVTSLAMVWRPLVQHRLPLLILSGAVALGACHALAHETKSGDVLGQEHWWLDDDMMISLRYARNLAEGEGLVWNPGERVEGYTNFLWTLMLVAPHWILPPETVSLAVILMNTGLLLLLLLVVHQTMTSAGSSGFAAGVATLFLATSASVLNWTVGGGETILLALMLVLLARPCGEPLESSRAVLLHGLLAGACLLVRPDAAVAVAALLVASLACRANRPRVPLLIGAAALLPVLHLGFRLWYYGEWLPNTWHLKGTGWDGRTDAGIRYLKGLLASHFPLLILATMAVAFRRQRLPWLLAVVGHLAYVVQVGGDELPQQRFFLPVLPLAVMLATEAAAKLGEAWNRRTGAAATGQPAVLLPALLLVWAGFQGAVLPGTVPFDMSIRAQSEKANVQVGLLLRTNTQPEARIAHFWAGAAPYFSERPAIDLFGKCDAHVARTEAHPGIHAAGHAKYDLDHSLGLEPDVIVGGDPPTLGPEQLAQRQASDYRAFADLVLHPLFEARYRRNVVGWMEHPGPLWVSRDWHGIYVRDTTTLARPAREWRAP